jgi:D-alanine transaminase
MMFVYLNGEYIPEENARISTNDRGFLFSDGIYEVIRSYDGTLFEPSAHLARLGYGARALRLTETGFDYLPEVASELIRRNGLESGDATVYIQVTRGSAPRTHRFPPKDTPLTVYVTVRRFNPHDSEQQQGIAAILVPDQRWARCDVKSTALLPNVLANQQAVDAGAFEALFVREGMLMEGTHSNVFVVVKGEVITPPLTNYILGGITRGVILELCHKLRIPHRETTLLSSDIPEMEEIMIVGTTVEVTPVRKILNVNFQNRDPGPLTRRLQSAFRERVRQGTAGIRV